MFSGPGYDRTVDSAAARWAIALAVLGGATLRVAFLGADSFWLDEANSVVIATSQPVSELWAHADPRHPPLYYIILKGVVQIAGQSEWAARGLSAAASLGNLALIYVLARRGWLSPRVSLLAVALLAVSPVDIWQAREARMYELAATACLVMAIGLTADSWLGVLVTAAGAALAIHLDYTTIPVVALLVGLWWARWWRTSRETSGIARLGVSLALLAVLVLPLWNQLRDLASLVDGATVFTNIKRAVGSFVLTPQVVLAGLVLEVIAAALAGIMLSRMQKSAVGRVAIGAFVVANAVLALPRGYTAKQVVVTVWPVVALFTAWLLGSRTRLASAVVGVSLVFSLASLTTHRADWRGVVQYLNREAQPGSVVVVDPSWNSIVYDYYEPVHASTPAAGDGTAAAAAGQDIWLIAERYGQPVPTSASEAWLDQRRRLVDVIPFSRLEVRHYRLR